MASAAAISVPGNGPTGDELVARARAMIPVLRQRAAQCVAGRDVPAQSIAEMQEAGFFRILQPRRWGGYEMHPNVFYDVQRALAEGCMSTGWMFGVVGCHPYEIALFHEEAQAEVWGQDTSTLVSSSYQPVGKVTPVEGGYRLSGRWGFSTGSVHCQWVVLGAMVPPREEGGAPDMRAFLLPRSDYAIDTDAWRVFGLQGTGSHDVIVDDVFVPEHRTHRSLDGFLCTNPGQQTNPGPLYTLPWAQVFMRSVSTAAFGGARAAINAAIEIAESRVSTNTGKASKNDPFLMAAIARAHAEVTEMEQTLRLTFDDLMGHAERGEAIPMDKRTLYAYNSASVVRRMADLVDDMVKLLGGRAIYNHSPIIQPWLDLHAGRAHVANDPNNRTQDLVGAFSKQPPNFTFL
ncbi:Acyl-CoA dehydrogenase, type 2, C-terminal domain (plasmid) [Novosphingobium aromaticivorans DSM 12444]|uniref:Acyl-CoA dehydrogenase, type 2, C-terminal domain n=1 Tax=Novosphingobium aromaticivorans (strain ATCC 700278 / DSM 12444 / CCUG 56034 / CIP 105152 / NBRC 16084 / F199) TaxID=279238 RepID=A4XF39_NOVAD|nr:acyl-CoA dehydrogenase family protein [Novosphingobium aromaticivorans]ABP64550.1 Acyl-CoA dehydrogenase, type 2, C-terminal domain [Novosphingobium aromaticivorans DSM 12444]ABP64607.1 Acyl-CoA dehydrogenase, type 2, C-terminal domain [Novosphingobium aromaticivorans DSM 12444]SCY92310.1 3-hydroxy-9,10-secoandrosta-1,3,5(10)-triene-9,17-dione monooxygenase [Novosphingobium aromaticivorans]SCY94870.1 3-hydroxy-9,10-secoandrosta-1,3,5(10)-triene-9,17-dione monooxygenase [Novosphingobium aroma